MRNTQRKGDIAVTQAIATFTRMGYDVSVPLSESAAYDLIIDDGQGLHRVQSKYSKSINIDLRCIHSNSNGYVVKHYADRSFDWLYVLTPVGTQHLLREFPSNRSYISINKLEIL